MSNTNTYLVTGATGNIGRSVVSTLLDLGHKVHAYTRNPSSPSAQHLSSLGAALFPGDFLSPSALATASKDCTGIFILTIPGPDAATHAHTAVTSFLSSCSTPDPVIVLVTSIWQNAASTQLLHSPRGGLPGHTDDKPPHPFTRGYWQINDGVETVVKTSGAPHWTILRPAWFMSNYHDFNVRPIHWPALSRSRKLVAGVRPDTPWEMNDPHDIGVFAAHALVESGRTRWEHKCLDIASEMLTLEEKAAVISRVSGVEVQAVFLDEQEATELAGDDFVGYLWFWHKTLAPKVDMEEMRRYGFELGGFEAYLTKNKEALIHALNDNKEAQMGLKTDELLAAAGHHGT